MTDQTILIVEDEPKIAQLLADYLQAGSYNTHQIHQGSTVVNWVKQHKPSAILLDLMLPQVDGLEICRQIRQFSQVPILMLTAKVEEIDRLIGLEIGADDYICKPFSSREVVARVKVILRRLQNHSNNHISPLSLDERTLMVNLNGKSCELTAIEFHLITKLNTEPGRIFHREQLMNDMYNDNRIVSYRTIDSHIKKLRKKLALLEPNQDLVQSVYGVGYKLVIH